MAHTQARKAQLKESGVVPAGSRRKPPQAAAADDPSPWAFAAPDGLPDAAADGGDDDEPEELEDGGSPSGDGQAARSRADGSPRKRTTLHVEGVFQNGTLFLVHKASGAAFAAERDAEGELVRVGRWDGDAQRVRLRKRPREEPPPAAEAAAQEQRRPSKAVSQQRPACCGTASSKATPSQAL